MEYEKIDDKTVKRYIKRAEKLVGITLAGDARTPENIIAIAQAIVEVAKMLQIEEIEFKKSIRAL